MREKQPKAKAASTLELRSCTSTGGMMTVVNMDLTFNYTITGINIYVGDTTHTQIVLINLFMNLPGHSLIYPNGLCRENERFIFLILTSYSYNYSL